MDIRTVTTDASVWKFDLDRMMFVRLPLNEKPVSSRVPYTGEWEPFTQICRNGKFLMVARPVPWGQGQWRETGNVLTDTHSVLPYPDLDDYPEPVL